MLPDRPSALPATREITQPVEELTPCPAPAKRFASRAGPRVNFSTGFFVFTREGEAPAEPPVRDLLLKTAPLGNDLQPPEFLTSPLNAFTPAEPQRRLGRSLALPERQGERE